MMADVIFVVGALIVLAGAVGVVATRSPIYAAMSLVTTLFGVAVLFLFVIMLLGVDRLEDLRTDPLVAQRWAGLAVAIVVGAGLLFIVMKGKVTGALSSTAKPTGNGQDVFDISRLLFTDYLFAFEITSLLLVIGVVGAVALAKRSRSTEELIDANESPNTFTETPLEEAAP